MPSGTWESAGSGFGPPTTTSISQRRPQSTATTQQRLAPLGKKPLVTPRHTTPEASSASTRKPTQSKLSAASFGTRRPLTERADNARPTASCLRTAGSSASSSSAVKGKGKQRARERDDDDAGSNKDEQATSAKDKTKKPSGWPSFAGLFSRRASKSASSSTASPAAPASTSTSGKRPSLGRAILNPSPSSLSRQRSTSRQLAFSDSDSASDGEDARKKRRRTDRGGFGKLDLVGAEEGMGGMGSQEGGFDSGREGKRATRRAIEMNLDGAADEEQQHHPSPSRSSRRDLILTPSCPSSSSASSTGCTAETLQAQLVPPRRRSPFSRPVQHRKPVILVPDSSPEKPMSGSYAEEPETEDDDDEDEDEEEAVLDALVRRLPAGGKGAGEVDDSGFAEAEELDLVSSPTSAPVPAEQEKEKDGALPSVVDLSLASSSSPAVAALPARRTASSSGANKLIVATSSPSPSPSSAQDSPSSGSGSEGRDSLGRTASAILMPPPPLPARKRLRRGAPSTRAAAEEEEREKQEAEKEQAERGKEKEKKGKRRARVLVEETQEEEEEDSRARVLAEWDARPVDVLCDETQPLALGPSEEPAWHAFPPSSLPLPLPTPRPLVNPISSPERFYPTPFRRALANSHSSRSRTSSSDGSSPTADQQPSASAPAALSSPLRSLDLGLVNDDAILPSPEPVGLVARAASVWVRQPAPPPALVPAASTSASSASPALPAEVQAAWVGARPLSPPPPPEARQTKLAEFFPRSAPALAAPAAGEGDNDDFVPESQHPDVSGAWTIDGVGLEAAVALQRAVEGTAFWARKAGPSGLGAVVEEEEIEEAEEGREEEEIPDSDTEEDDAAPSLFSAALGLPCLPLPPIGPPSSPSAASSSTSSSARLRLKRPAPGGASPLGTPVKRRFPVYSPSKMRAAVERAARPVSAAAMLVAAVAVAPQQGMEEGGGPEQQEEEEEKEETQWESYWSYPASSPADAAEERPKKEDRQQALLDKLLASAPTPVRARSTSAAPTSASFCQERQSSSLSPLPSSPPAEDAQPARDDEVVDSDPEEERGEFEESLFSFVPAVTLPSGWRRDARTGELVKVRDVEGFGEGEGGAMEE